MLLYVKTSLFVQIINYHKLLQKHVVNTFKIKNKIFYYAKDIFSYKYIKRLCENIFSKHIIIINLNIILSKLFKIILF